MRIHLCQILFNPAYYDDGCDMLEEPFPILESTQALGPLREIDIIGGMLVESKALYIDYIKKKILEIATWSLNRKANLLVFPEYSIPVDVLPDLCLLAKKFKALIIAGTHRIRLTDASRNIYQTINITINDSDNGTAVAPILLPDGSTKLSFKRTRSKWEHGLTLGPEQTDIYNVSIDNKPIYVAVTPCLDSLKMDKLGMLWSNDEVRPSILICPSFSPTIDTFNTVGELVLNHEALFTFTNSALFGGTSSNIPTKWASYISGHSKYLGGLPANVEAILEYDVNPESFFVKRGSVVAESPCKEIREFPIIYGWNNLWVDKYMQLGNEVIGLLKDNNVDDAAEWIDIALSEQDIPFPTEIVSRLKDIRYRNIPLFSGDVSSIQDCFDIALLGPDIEDTNNLFARRIAKSLDIATKAFLASSEKNSEALISCLQGLKKAETRFGHPIQESINETTEGPIESRLDRFTYIPPESVLASFQDRGQKLDELRDVIAQGSERVIVITGMPGIGKTDLLTTLFLKILIDWKPLWIKVAPGSSFSRVVAEFGNMFGIKMDADSLSTVSDVIFRQKITKLFDSLFSLERRALIIDDLKNLRGNGRDYHQLQSFIEEAARIKEFTGSRLFLVSSISSSPLWVHRAGIARIHLRGLEDTYSRRVLEYQLRTSGLCTGEVIPDIPQVLLSIIDGLPLAAKIAAEASRKYGLGTLANEIGLSDITSGLTDVLLPRVDLDTDEKNTAYAMAVFRLPVSSNLITNFIPERNLSRLASKAIIDFDGHSYGMHPIIRKFFYDMIPKEEQSTLHRKAVEYYDQLKINENRRNDFNTDLELVHHLALAGDVRRLSELRANLYDEIFPAARQLYTQQRYDKALDLFLSLAEIRPNDPIIWAYVGRCHGRRGQWFDCDNAFKQSLQAAEKAKQPTWWIHRDWGHIKARFGFYPDASQHLIDAKRTGERVDPSCVAAEAFIAWKSGKIQEAHDGFENVLRLDPKHTYTLSTYARFLDEQGEVGYADELRKRLMAIENEMVSPPDYDIEDETDSPENE